MLVVPSPKSHAHAVTDPEVVLVNVTLFSGATPLIGVMLKFTAGADAEVTVIGVPAVLTELPPGPVAVSLTV